MNASQDLPVAGLEQLLAALRAAGLPVGAPEILRLHHVFALAPGLSQDRPPEDQLRDLLASALTHDPKQRQRFDEVYEPWSRRWDGWAHQRSWPSAAASTGPEAGQTSSRPPKKRRRRHWQTAARLLALALLAMSLLEERRSGATLSSEELTAMPEAARIIRRFEYNLKPVHIVWLPRLTVIDEGSSEWRPAWAPLGLGSLALVATGLLAWRYRRRQWIPSLLPEPLPGPARLPLLPLTASGPELLDAGSAETLVWGVDRHVTEQLTSEVDLEATTQETANAGGLPELRFEPERRLREVWLWLDVLVDDDALERWAEEIAGSLESSGLPVRIGGFNGLPDELAWDEGHIQRPIEIEAHRETALVAICTDGEVLLQQLEEEPGLVRPLLTSLVAWQRLAIVDFSTRTSRVRKTLAGFGLAVVTPEELPAYFGLGLTRPAEPMAIDPGEIRAWRAALALGGRPVDRPTAFAARRALDLELSPWAYDLLVEGDPEDSARPSRLGGRLSWGDDARAALVSWLAEGSLEETSGIREGSLLERSLDFWQTRLATESERRAGRTTIEPWEKRPAKRHLQMERALLRLWREPRSAAEELYELGNGELAELVRSHLRRLAPRDCRQPSDGLIPLPWRLTGLDDRSRYLLAERGLGGLRRGALASSGRLGLGLGMLGGLAGLMLVLGGIGRHEVVGVAPRFVTAGVPPKSGDAIVEERQLDDRWQVVVKTADGPQVVGDIGDGAVIEVAWETMKFVALEGGTFRMGSEEGDPLAFPDERPAHDVMVGAFWVGQTEVTNSQYRHVDPNYPDDERPAVNVNWKQARDFCQSLGSQYDLPTEAEWEYAARAGTSAAWSFGDSEDLIGRFAWFGEAVIGDGKPAGEAHLVGQKQSNPWRLFDIHGNVWEWVLDCWDANAYQRRAQDTPIPDPSLAPVSCHQNDISPSTSRVIRGGAFDSGPLSLRSAFRNRDPPMSSLENVGFRCVRRANRQP